MLKNSCSIRTWPPSHLPTQCCPSCPLAKTWNLFFTCFLPPWVVRGLSSHLFQSKTGRVSNELLFSTMTRCIIVRLRSCGTLASSGYKLLLKSAPPGWKKMTSYCLFVFLITGFRNLVVIFFPLACSVHQSNSSTSGTKIKIKRGLPMMSMQSMVAHVWQRKRTWTFSLAAKCCE